MSLKTDMYNKTIDLIEIGWVKGVYATDADGKAVLSTVSEAVNFCLVGALFKARQLLSTDEPWTELEVIRSEILTELGQNIDNVSVFSFNDHSKTKKEDVINLLVKCRDKGVA